MAKRRAPSRPYYRSQLSKMSSPSLQRAAVSVRREWQEFTKRASHYLWTLYCAMNGNYIAVITVIVVVILSFLLPDITQKLHTTYELKSMKKVVSEMSTEIKRAEVACLTVADEIRYLHCSVNDNTTETPKQEVQDLSVCTSRTMRITQSEPVQVERKVGFFRRFFFPNRNVSNKEIAIMSYVYTNSFNGIKPEEQNPKDDSCPNTEL